MTITRVGSTSKYANGWDVAFGGKKKSSSAKDQPQASAKKGAKPAKKAAAKKATAGKAPVAKATATKGSAAKATGAKATKKKAKK